MPDAKYIARTENVSGELFDLSIPSLNNEFGWKHITGIIRYGISFPLEKFIDELETILKDGGPPDDKSSKREARLRFLYHCFESKEIQDLFPLFCNYINGGGDESARTWVNGQYQKNFFIITVAGGNIMTLFAQLLVNIIDCFTKATNAQFDAPDYEYEDWDIHADSYSPEIFDDGQASETCNFMFDNSFRTWEKINWDIINETYRLLTDTNKLLLETLEDDSQFTKEQIAFLITSHFLNNDHDGRVESDIRFVARAPYSDFDFKLSPNMHPEKISSYRFNEQELINELGRAIQHEQEEPPHTFGSPAGFLLLRAKTIIVCNSSGTLPQYTASQLKKYQKDCAKELGPWVYSLFPQTMQAEYLDRVRKDSNCYKYLNYLMQKKLMIGDATRNNVDEILKFYLSGYYKPTNRRGSLYAVVPESPNSTEAIIGYLKHTTYNLNIYILHWETITDKGYYKLSHHAAPALHNGGLPKKFTYKSCCYGFLNLNNILYQNSGLIARLGCDIINYFLNQSPIFHTETILDKLIESVNNERFKITNKSNQCYMPPSDLILVPNKMIFSASLKNLKHIFNTSRYSELGYPDGVRITINAIESDSKIPDTRLDELEYRTQQIAEADDDIQTEYLPLPTRWETGSRGAAGVSFKYKKQKTIKHKKFKTKKYKKHYGKKKHTKHKNKKLKKHKKSKKFKK